MKYTMNTAQAVNELMNDEYANWSYNGAQAVIEYLERIEEDTGDDIEFDRVAIRCDYDEYSSASEAYASYNAKEAPGDTIEEREKSALEWLENKTVVIPFDGGIIIQAF